MDMVPVQRASMDRHLLAARYLAQQLTTPLAHIARQNREAVLRDPHKMVFAVPDRMAASLVMLHPETIASLPSRLKARGLRIPKRDSKFEDENIAINNEMDLGWWIIHWLKRGTRTLSGTNHQGQFVHPICREIMGRMIRYRKRKRKWQFKVEPKTLLEYATAVEGINGLLK